MVGVVKRDDVRRALVPEKCFVQLRHFRCRNETDSQVGAFNLKQFRQERLGDPPQQAEGVIVMDGRS